MWLFSLRIFSRFVMCSVYQCFISFYSQLTLQCIDRLQIHLFARRWAFGFFSLWALMNSASLHFLCLCAHFCVVICWERVLRVLWNLLLQGPLSCHILTMRVVRPVGMVELPCWPALFAICSRLRGGLGWGTGDTDVAPRSTQEGEGRDPPSGLPQRPHSRGQ